MKKNYLLSGLLILLSLSKVFAQCSTTNATSCVCAQSLVTNCDLLPDLIVGKPPLLVSGTAGVIEYSQTGNGVENGRLRVSVSSPNIGFGPLEIRAQAIYICGTDTFFGTSPGTCPVSGLPPKQLITQRVYHKNAGVMTYYDRPAGSMTYHPTHGHMHVDDWGIYTLRSATTDPNPLNWPVIGTGAKLAFCLEDYGSCSGYAGHCVDSLGNILLNNNFPNYGLGGGAYNCSPIVQGISSGYTDIYYQYLDGMYLTIPPGTCNGNYYIVVQLDPYNYFIESNENNNVIAVPYTLTQQAGTVPPITASGPTSFCPGGSVILSTSPGSSYLWSNGATTQSITVSTSGTFTVSVSSNSCNGISPPITITQNALPVTASASNSSICAGQSSQLSSSASSLGFTNVPATFTNNAIVNIPDNNPVGVVSAISVLGINPVSLLSNSIVSVAINLTHTYDDDLIISLISPSGNSIFLSNRHGGSGDNFVNTVFSMTAATAIASGTPPFTGSFIPDGAFSSFTGNVNGTWQLKVADVVGNDIGTINSWSIIINSQVVNPISFAWASSPAGFTSAQQNPSVSPGANTVYTVTATDMVTGCTGTSSASISVNPIPSANATSNSPVCENNMLQLNQVGGGNTFSWIGPNNFTSSTKNPFINNTTPSASGTYTVTVTSSAGCSKTSSVNVSVLNLPVLSAAVSQVSCFGGTNGSINLGVTNNSGASYLWSNGASTEDISGLVAGEYQVTVTNAACNVNSSYTVTEPVALSCLCNTQITHVVCRGGATGSASAIPSGGTSPYSYLWNNGQTSQTATGLIAGTYSVTVTDANGCTIAGSSVIITEPAVLSSPAVITNVSCAGVGNGAINLTVNGGTAPYLFLWSNGATTKDISSIQSGTYTVTITDNCGATKVKSSTVGLKSTPFTLSLTKTTVRCAGGSSGNATVSVSNGTAPYSYSWNTVPVKTTSTISGLSVGTYIVTVSDANGCTKSGSVYISQPTYINALVTQVNVSLPGGNNGSASVSVSGGVGPYTYSWNTVPVQTTSSITGLVAGVYKCTILDSKQCQKKVTVTITQPANFNTRGLTGNMDLSVFYLAASPNPSKGVFELKYNAEGNGYANVCVFDLIGNKVFSEKIKSNKGYNSKVYDLKYLSKGVYFTQLEVNGQKRTVKLIIQ